jgi:predicted DsbA family dithiol-disulfide isomerase
VASVLIPIYFDYASALCYVAWKIVNELERELEFEALWKGVPIRLRSHASRPGNPIAAAERAKIASVVEQTGVRVTPPKRWIDSGAALMGSEIARDADLKRDGSLASAHARSIFKRFHAGVFRAAFEEGWDISNLEQLVQLAADAGMNADDFERDLGGRVMAPRIVENKQEADRFSALGYPTFMLGEFPLIGIQPKDTMRLLLSRFIEQRRSEPQA